MHNRSHIAYRRQEPGSAFSGIPTPDSTGLVKDYDKLYPAKKFTAPACCISSSQTVEEQLVAGLAHGCKYFMDERDVEWLEKRNEEARGEGTSAQAALSVNARIRRVRYNVSEKLEVFTSHFADACGLVRKVRQREDVKLRSMRHWHNVWLARVSIVNLKRKNPWLDKVDEELFVDRAPAAKKPDVRLAPISIKSEALFVTPPARTEPANSYIPPLVPFASRLFKFMARSSASASPESKASQRKYVRLRRGRGGRMMLDRRGRHSLVRDTDSEDVDEETRRLKERWRFDSDDAPPFGESYEERDPEPVADYGLSAILFSYLQHTFRLLSEVDTALLTDPSIVKYDPESGRKETIVPFTFGFSSIVRPPPMASPNSQRTISTPPTMNDTVGTSSDGSARPDLAVEPITPSSVSSAPYAKGVLHHAPAANGTNGRAAIYLGISKVESTIHPPLSTEVSTQNCVSQPDDLSRSGSLNPVHFSEGNTMVIFAVGITPIQQQQFILSIILLMPLLYSDRWILTLGNAELPVSRIRFNGGVI
ncbi:uncharacterized protein BT62DRAFT_921377 [Guyanagaster necrorhizus]|uniref:Enhancer of polycomb-like N-terminal domain-containing protein n=1 Tax=Guyanagaster necrorhizus TaxID=856835 RepID=A0A9P8ARQ5_9AGAR|nr:uncharacterized protein BT62DRAFT_921377 [Guyanagaster necrorhizus MCA 3950]KAG7444097.1 hypothetical protein BT62DRAFT_921377 [Guyanagaster necrorhizus MCA 3950]